MASIHEIPLRFDAAANGRLTKQLAALVDAGVDLGPRHHQIAMIRASIREALRVLPEALDAAADLLPTDDPSRREAVDAVQRFTEVVEGVIRKTEPPMALSPAAPPSPSA